MAGPNEDIYDVEGQDTGKDAVMAALEAQVGGHERMHTEVDDLTGDFHDAAMDVTDPKWEMTAPNTFEVSANNEANFGTLGEPMDSRLAS